MVVLDTVPVSYTFKMYMDRHVLAIGKGINTFQVTDVTQYFGQNYVENKTVPKMSNKKWFKIWPEWTKDFYLKFFKTFFSFLHLKKFSHEIAM